jgi:plastocyanin
MKNQWTIVRNGIYLLCSFFLLNGCLTAETTPKLHTVEIKQMQFQPSELTVQKGDTVVFINKDLVVHDVAEEADKAWSSSSLPPGQSYSLVVNKSADYYCTIHPVMKGKLLVQ